MNMQPTPQPSVLLFVLLILTVASIGVALGMRRSRAFRWIFGLGLAFLVLPAFVLSWVSLAKPRMLRHPHQAAFISSGEAPVVVGLPTELVMSVDQNADGQITYEISNEFRPQQLAELRQLNKELVPDVYASARQAAKTLGRRLAMELYKADRDEDDRKVQVVASTFEGVTGEEAEELADLFVESAMSELNSDLIQLVTEGDEPGDGVIATLKLTATNTLNEVADTRGTSTLNVELIDEGFQLNLSANITERRWVRNAAEEKPLDLPSNQFVESGEPENNLEAHSGVVQRMAKRLRPVLASRWNQLSESGWDFHTSVANQIEPVSEYVAERLVIDEFEQSYPLTVEGESRSDPARRRFALVDYSDENLRQAIREADMHFRPQQDRGVASAPPVTYTTRPAPAPFFNSPEVPVLLALLAIFLGVQAITRVFEKSQAKKLLRHR